jgi:hypothetical protein
MNDYIEAKRSLLPAVTEKVNAPQRLLDAIDGFSNQPHVTVFPRDDSSYKYGLVQLEKNRRVGRFDSNPNTLENALRLQRYGGRGKRAADPAQNHLCS